MNNNNYTDLFQLIKQEKHSGKIFSHITIFCVVNKKFLYLLLSSALSVVDLIQGTLNNTSLILNIFCQLMVLPLAYQLTCIAGNLLVGFSFIIHINSSLFILFDCDYRVVH